MKKIIITETQLGVITKNLLNEAVGVPENILESGKKLYELVVGVLKNIKTKKNVYTERIKTELKVSDEVFTIVNLTINVRELGDIIDNVQLVSAGVGNYFNFNENILMQVNLKDYEIELNVNFVTPTEWRVSDLYDTFTSNKAQNTSIMTHELKHKFDRQKKRVEKVGTTANYQTFSANQIRTGIPVIENFMMFSYFIHNIENLVRPSEFASRMTQQGITREQFYDFITNDKLFNTLKTIREFSFDYLISELYNEMDRVDLLIKHIGGDPENMSDKAKIVTILELMYINIINRKIENFDSIFLTQSEIPSPILQQLFSGSLLNLKPEKGVIRRKYLNRIGRYTNREIDFFKDECKRFNRVAIDVMKKISKVYSLIPDEKEQTNESILDWDLHQKLMEKKYGKRPIQTSYNFKK